MDLTANRVGTKIGPKYKDVKSIDNAVEIMIRLNKKGGKKESYSGTLTDHVTTWQWNNKKRMFV